MIIMETHIMEKIELVHIKPASSYSTVTVYDMYEYEFSALCVMYLWWTKYDVIFYIIIGSETGDNLSPTV